MAFERRRDNHQRMIDYTLASFKYKNLYCEVHCWPVWARDPEEYEDEVNFIEKFDYRVLLAEPRKEEFLMKFDSHVDAMNLFNKLYQLTWSKEAQEHFAEKARAKFDAMFEDMKENLKDNLDN